jgi:hypothetical protein
MKATASKISLPDSFMSARWWRHKKKKRARRKGEDGARKTRRWRFETG